MNHEKDGHREGRIMIPSYYEFQNPVRIISGNKALDNLPYELDQLGVARPLIVTDQGISKAGLVRYVIQAFGESEMTVGGLYDQVPPDSSLGIVKELAAVFRENRCDCIVAIGGGSVMDTAKGVNILVTEGADDLLQFEGAERLKRPLKPLVVIPTTSGTGSEVTSVAVIADPDNNTKLAFSSRRLLPRLAILDPRMTLTLPAHITAATAMDALTHAIEACICLQKNPLSDAYAWAAMNLLREHLIPVIKNGKDPVGRLALANAACMAGVAFSNSMVGMVHSLGHACGGLCHVPHGVAMNIFLPHVLEYNMHKVTREIAGLLLPLAGPEVYARTPEEKRAEETIACIRRLQADLHEQAKLPRTLKEAGVPREALEGIARAALGDGSLTFNPEEMNYEEALRVLNDAY